MSDKKMVTIEMFVHHCNYSENKVQLCNCDMSAHGYAFLGKVSVTFPMPEKDPVVAKVEALELMLKTLQDETFKKSQRIKDEIQSLMAIGHYVEPPSGFDEITF